VFVSHNRDFIDACCTHILAITADGRSLLTEGKIEDYERAAQREGFPNILSFEQAALAKEAPKASNKDVQPNKNEAKKLKTRRQQLIKLIATSEKTQEKSRSVLAELEKNMSILSGNSDAYEKIVTLQKELITQQDLLEQTEETWLELSDELERVEQELKSLGRL
jgi:ATPase subunit of ABC transporter with duplicated ATPase domains